MEKKTRITFIGPGVMAEGMIAGLLRKGLVDPQNLIASGPILERGEELKETYGLISTDDNLSAVAKADVVVFSVKPQILNKVLEELHNTIPSNALVLSIVAGAPIEKFIKGLKHKSVVRAMPNTPGQIGEGISVWTASKDVTPQQLELARMILGALGEELFMEEESYLDKATALSGSGPAYVYLFMEAMVDAGVHLGFSRRDAERLVSQTVRGSVDYFESRQPRVHLAHLRNQVTSPGGTSAEALYYLEKAGLRTAMSRAVWAAFTRSRELGQDAQSRPPNEG
ncbi:MAG: pyrroline-5-carboxylate reductase [Anaerolineales bacterium]|nr:pyrroline-5-carboxylate reductase [Anaerolineales bacterium]